MDCSGGEPRQTCSLCAKTLVTKPDSTALMDVFANLGSRKAFRVSIDQLPERIGLIHVSISTQIEPKVFVCKKPWCS